MAGKDKTERGFRLLWDSNDLSGDLVPGSISGGGFVFDEIDMTGVSNAVKNFLSGFPNSDITARFYLNDTLLTGSYVLLPPDVGNAQTLTLRWGQAGAAPVAGDLEWEGAYLLLALPIISDGGRLLLDATFKASSTTPPAWGTVSA